MSTVRIQLRRGTSSDWTSINPVLAAGEAGFESDTLKIKIGNGTAHWNDLGYATVTPTELSDAVAAGIGSQLTAGDVNTALGYTAANAADLSSLGSQTSTDISDAIVTAENYTDSAISEEVTNRNSAIATSLATAEGYTDVAIDNEIANRNSAINVARNYAMNQAEIYTDSAITAEVSNRNSAITTAVNDLVNGAPGILNTLGEIATALQSDESTATSLASTVAGKVSKSGDTMLGALEMGNNKITGVATPVATGDAATKGYVDSGLTEVQTSAGNYTDTQVATEATNRISEVTAAITTVETYADNKFAPKDSPTFTGTITAPQNSLDGLTISDLSITTTKLDDLSVTSPKIAAGSITNDKLATLSVSGDKIQDATISSDKIISVNKDKVTDLYVDAVFSGTTVLPDTTSIGSVTSTEIGHVSGVTSSIQAQLNANATSASNNATEISNHESATQNVHGISDTATLATKTYADNSSSAAANSAITTAEAYTDSKIATEVTNRNSAIATSLSTSEGYTDTAISTEVTNRNSAINSAISTEASDRSTAVTAAISTSEAFATSADSTLHTTITGEIATAKSQAETYADSLASNYDAAGAAATAQSNVESYADDLISTEVTNRNSAISTAKSQAISTAEGYTDNAISNLVNGAPSTLDTLKEIADALGSDANLSTTITNYIASTKADAEAYTDSSIATEVTNRNSAISSAVADGKSQAISTSEAYTDSAISTEVSNRNTAIGASLSTAESYTDTAKSAAISTSESYTDTAISTEVTNRDSAILTAKNAAIATSEGYTDTAISTEVTNRNSAIATSLATAEGYTDTAKSAAISTSESYTDTAISTEVTNRNSAIATANSQAISTSEGYADSVIATEVSNRNTAISNATANMVQTTDTGSVTSTMILDGTIVNADINASAAIAYNKLNLASSITSADIVDGTIVNGDISSSAAIADTKLATITSSGKVANSATTATDSNTANAIVSRDASGNFIANLITVNTAPTSAGHAASKAYVDNIAAGMNWHGAVVAATSGVLPSSTYADGTTDANGGLGIGATLTATANAALAIDSVSVSNGNRVLIKNQADAKQNGIYIVTDKGSASTRWILTRATDSDNHIIGEVSAGDAVYVLYGSVNTNQSFVATMIGSGTNGLILIGTDNITWTQFSGASSFVAGSGLVRTGNTVDVVSSTLNVTVDSVDLATVSQSNTTGGNLANGIVSAITVDSYGRVTGYQTGAQNVASTSNKGIASFDPASFTVTSGNAVIKSGGISNTQLANNSVTIGSTSISLGGTVATLAGLTLTTPVIAQITNTGTLTLPTSTDTLVGRATTDTLTNKSISGSTNTLSNIGNTSLTNSSITINGNAVSLGGSVSGLATNASPTFTGTVTLPLTTAGYVTTTSGGSISSVATIPNLGLTNSSVTVGTTAIALGASSTTLSGLTSVTSTAFVGGLTGNVSGNASTATALATPRNINGVAFDGSAAITITAANPNALTIGTGLSGTSYTGSGAVTIAIDSTVATLTGSQTLTNKTLSSAVATGGITYNGATSGTIVVKASDVAGSNTLTFPAATDTLVGKATTDTLTNKTFDTAGTGNVFKIAGTQISTNTGTGAMVLATSPTVTGLSTDTLNTTGNVVVGGNLTVNGTTTTINSTTLNTTEQVLVISNTATPTDVTANGAGITIKGTTDKTVKWYSSTGALTSSENIDLATSKTYKIAGTDVLTSTKVLGRTPGGTTSGDIVTIDGSQTLTNKTISGSQLTSASVANSALTNSTISGVSLGSNLNALTLGTGLTGTSYNGSGAVTAAIDTSVVTTLSGTQTLTNKTLTSPSLGTPTVTGTITLSSSGATFSDGTVQTTAGVASLTTIGTAISASNGTYYPSQYRDQMVPISGAYALTIAPDGTNTAAIGTSVDFYQSAGTGASFVAGSGVTILSTPGLKLRTTGSVATIMKTAANTWLLFGDLSA